MDKRIMVAELDSIAQQEVFDAATDRAAAVRAISGWLRSALVLSGRILVTDSMLLDGRYFMELGPECVARELGASVRDLPLTICGVQPTLRAGLEQKLAQPGFEWQLHYGLSTRPDKPAKHHRRVWEKWLLALDEGSITYVCVLPPSPIGPNGHPGLPLDPGPLVDDLPMDTEFLHFSPEIRGFAEESMEFTSRSVFVGRLAEAMSQPLPAEADPDPVERDRQWQLVRSRWNQSYLESLARRNRASWITFNELPGRAPDVKRRGERVFRVSHRFLERMGAITPAAFGSTYSLLNRQQEDFRRTATAGNLRTLVYAAMASLEVSNRNHVIWGSFARILLAAAAIGVALPTFSTGGIGLEATWVAFGGAALATTPWSEILRLLQLLPTSGRTRLVMFGNE